MTDQPTTPNKRSIDMHNDERHDFAARKEAKSNEPGRGRWPEPTTPNTDDTRDLETKLRQDLGLLEWQIRDILPIIEAEVRKGYAPEDCKTCNGTGMEICSNPDHNFIDAVGWGDTGRLGCPLCGHDDKYRIPNTKCCDCDGTGKEKLYTATELAQAELDTLGRLIPNFDGVGGIGYQYDDERRVSVDVRMEQLEAQLNPQKPKSGEGS